MQHNTPLKNWILLRGLAREQQHWGEFIAHCQQRFPGYRFYALDLPGCGEKREQQSPLSIRAIRTALQQQVQEKRIGEPFGIVGVSMGAMVALEWLAAAPEQVAAIVAINTSVNDFPLFWRLRPAAMWTGLLALLTNSRAQRERRILRLVSEQHAHDDTVAADWLAIQQQRPVTRATIVRQLIAAARFSAPVFTAPKRGLILCSDGDMLVSYQCSLQLAQRYQWPLRCNTSAGHDLPLDDPLWVIQKLSEWLHADETENAATDTQT